MNDTGHLAGIILEIVTHMRQGMYTMILRCGKAVDKPRYPVRASGRVSSMGEPS